MSEQKKNWTHHMKREEEVLRVRVFEGFVTRCAYPDDRNGYVYGVGLRATLEETGWEFEDRVLTIREQALAVGTNERFILHVKNGGQILCRRLYGVQYQTLHNDLTYAADKIVESAYTRVEVLPDVHIHEFIGRPSACYCGAVES